MLSASSVVAMGTWPEIVKTPEIGQGVMTDRTEEIDIIEIQIGREPDAIIARNMVIWQEIISMNYVLN